MNFHINQKRLQNHTTPLQESFWRELSGAKAAKRVQRVVHKRRRELEGSKIGQSFQLMMIALKVVFPYSILL